MLEETAIPRSESFLKNTKYGTSRNFKKCKNIVLCKEKNIELPSEQLRNSLLCSCEKLKFPLSENKGNSIYSTIYFS